MSNSKVEDEGSKKSETEVNNSKATQVNKKERKTNWPLKSIKEPHDNDVLYGRGGGTNHHEGNKRYRKMVEGRKTDYVNSKRLDKPLVALEIIRQWRAQDPPGRFLKLDDATGLWNDVGDKRAREKTSQALREKAPQLRKQQEDEEKDENRKESSSSSKNQSSFDKDSKKKEGRPIVRAVLARDHTLGRDYLDPKESVTVKGFSWNEPLQGEDSSAPSSHYPASRQEGWDGVPFVVRGSGSPGDSRSNVHGQPSRESYMVTDREHSFANNPLREASISGPAHPWPEDDWDNRPEYNHNSMHSQYSYGDHSRDHSGDRPAYGRKQKMYVGSNDYDKLARMMEDNDRHNYRVQRSNSSHSAQSHDSGDFRNDTEPDYNLDQHDKRRYADNERYKKKGYSSIRHSKTDRRIHDSRYNYEPHSPYGEGPYNSPNTKYTESYIDSTSRLQDPSSSSENSSSRRTTHGHQHKLTKNIPKPHIVKRETSHQNENGETKSDVKRKFRRHGSYSGDATNISSLDKAQSFLPRAGVGAEDEMRALDQKMGRSTLDTPPGSREVSIQTSASKSNSRKLYGEKPKSLSSSQRLNTVDAVKLEFTTGIVVEKTANKPPPIQNINRQSTVDKFLSAVVESSKQIEKDTSLNSNFSDIDKKFISSTKPTSIHYKDRMSTEDAIALVMCDDQSVDNSSKYTVENRESTFGSSDDYSMKDPSSNSVAKSESTFGSIAENVIKNTAKYTIDNRDNTFGSIEESDIKDVAKFSIENRESTFGSIDIDIDHANPEKLWGEE